MATILSKLLGNETKTNLPSSMFHSHTHMLSLLLFAIIVSTAHVWRAMRFLWFYNYCVLCRFLSKRDGNDYRYYKWCLGVRKQALSILETCIAKPKKSVFRYLIVLYDLIWRAAFVFLFLDDVLYCYHYPTVVAIAIVIDVMLVVCVGVTWLKLVLIIMYQLRPQCYKNSSCPAVETRTAIYSSSYASMENANADAPARTYVYTSADTQRTYTNSETRTYTCVNTCEYQCTSKEALSMGFRSSIEVQPCT